MNARRDFTWSLRAPLDEVVAVLSEPADFARWWPASWLEATEVAPGDAMGFGRIVSARTRGRSPLSVAWSARCVSSAPQAWRYELYGELEGSLQIEVSAARDVVSVKWSWEVALRKAEVRSVPFIEGVFASDVGWMMERGEESLRVELDRRAAPDHARVAPGPASDSTLPWTLAGVGVVAALAGVVGFILGRRR